MMRDERDGTAAVVLAGSVVMDAGGVALWLVGGLAALFAIMLIAFGVMGGFQAVAIAFGRGQPRDEMAQRPFEDDR